MRNILGGLNRQTALIGVAYFVTMMGMGIVTPYLNLHLARIGLSGSAIGLISAALPLGGIVGPPLIATFADARGQVGRVIALTMMLAGTIFTGVVWANNQWLIIPLVFVFGMLIRSVEPLMDSSALDHVSARGGSFGQLRAFGSLGFMVAALISGVLATALGLRPMFMVAVGLMFTSTLFSRRFPAIERIERSPSIFAGLQGLAGGGLGRNFKLFATIIVVGHLADMTQLTFFAIHMDQLGIAESLTGVAWAIAVTSEVILLWNVDKLFSRFGVRTVVAIGLTAAALRWGLTAFATNAVIILAVQALHGLSFGAVYAGTVKFVHLEAPAGSQASGQAVIAGLRSAFGGVVGTTVIGYLSDMWNITSLYGISAGISVVAALLMATVVNDPTTREAVQLTG